MLLKTLAILISIFGSLGSAMQCMHPPPAPGYTDQKYSGTWYEVGKYQTAGGAIFQAGTVCTTATYNPYSVQNTGGDIGYSSRKHTPEGSYVNATGYLEPEDQPGHFTQTLEFYGIPGPSVDYNVVWLDEDSAIEFDCSEHIFGFLDYCVHFMSRTPTMAPEKLEAMKEWIAEMGLNMQDLDYMPGDQNNCWN